MRPSQINEYFAKTSMYEMGSYKDLLPKVRRTEMHPYLSEEEYKRLINKIMEGGGK